MIRQPSNIRSYSEFYSRDPAVIQLAEDPEKHALALRVARETGNWKNIILDGASPTIFTMRVLPGSTARAIADLGMRVDVGNAILNQLVVRSACVEVLNFGSFKLRLENDSIYGLGVVASKEFADILDAVDMGIVTELASEIMARAFLRPKS